MCACLTSIGHSALGVRGEILSQLLSLLLCDVQPDEGQGLETEGDTADLNLGAEADIYFRRSASAFI